MAVLVLFFLYFVTPAGYILVTRYDHDWGPLLAIVRPFAGSAWGMPGTALLVAALDTDALFSIGACRAFRRAMRRLGFDLSQFCA